MAPKKNSSKKSASVTSYLSSLSFKKGLEKTFQATYLKNIRFVILLIIGIVLLGSLSLTSIPRRLNPEINIPIVNVVTLLPGASPSSVESLITIPVEDELKKLDGLDTVSSVSSTNVSAVTLLFTSNTDSEKARADVQTAVDNASSSLPNDAQTPSVTLLDFDDQPVLTFVLTSDASVPSLMRAADDLEDTLSKLDRVDRVLTSGLEEEHIEIAFDQNKLVQYGLQPTQVQQLVSSSLKSYPAGTIETDTLSFALAIDPQVQSVADVRNLAIKNGSTSVRLGDIAQVTIRPKPRGQSVFYADQTEKSAQAVRFAVYKTKNSDIDEASQEITAHIDVFLDAKGRAYQVATVHDSAEEILTQFDDLFGEFRTTVILVFLLLCIFLGVRQAVIASTTIPLTFLASLAIIERLGMSLNFLTMFAFLLTLGLLIDDTIVVVAAMTRYYRTGKFTPMQTGILVWKDFIVPLWSTTITTIWAFVPLLLASGIIGEFIKPIPLVVTVTMLSSTSIAMLITIPMMVVILNFAPPRRVVILGRVLGLASLIVVAYILFPKNPLLPLLILTFLASVYLIMRSRDQLKKRLTMGKKSAAFFRSLGSRLGTYSRRGVLNIEALSFFYMRYMRRILVSQRARRGVITFLIVFAVVGFTLVPLGFVKGEFFPKTDEDLLFINVQLPAGTNLSTTAERAEELLSRLINEPEVVFAVAETGASAFDGSGGAGTTGSNIFNITLHLTDAQDRSVESAEIAQFIRNGVSDYQWGRVDVAEVSGGPPAGADVQVNLLGSDLQVLNTIAEDITDHLSTMGGLINIDTSIKQGASKYVFVPDAEALVANDMTVGQIGFWLRTYASDFELETLQEGSRETSISFAYSGLKSPENLYALEIPTSEGSIPLTQLGHFTLKNNPTSITREDGDKTISVTAAVESGVNSGEKNKALIAYMESKNLPQGYSWKTGGVNEENQESVQSILRAMVFSALLILITMVIEFKSFRQSLIALLIIPFSVAGVFYIFALFHIPLSFPALIGILALFGIVVTHVIVVIEKINENRKEGLSLDDAIVDAAGNRLEPVLLTSMATIAGLTPITMADPLWRGLGGAIIAGLIFSDAVKLLLVPILYKITYASEER